jgi:hypothetical protein
MLSAPGLAVHEFCHGEKGSEGPELEAPAVVGGVASQIAAAVRQTSVDVTPLLDLIAHADRIHVQAFVTGGHDNDLVSTLTIDPFSIPEPAALLGLLVGIGGVAWVRRK